MIKKGDLKCGEIIWVDFSPSVGHEYQGHRPAVVIQGDKQILPLNTLTVVPMTSNLSNRISDDILVKCDIINKLANDSLIKIAGITSFDYQRFIKKIGYMDNTTMGKIKKYLIKHFDLKI
ncbi:MAG: type II toxin-antitoxin system PemK/MazF family toxin [Patescibacteria group bacterium]